MTSDDIIIGGTSFSAFLLDLAVWLNTHWTTSGKLAVTGAIALVLTFIIAFCRC